MIEREKFGFYMIMWMDGWGLHFRFNPFAISWFLNYQKGLSRQIGCLHLFIFPNNRRYPSRCYILIVHCGWTKHITLKVDKITGSSPLNRDRPPLHSHCIKDHIKGTWLLRQKKTNRIINDKAHDHRENVRSHHNYKPTHPEQKGWLCLND